MLIVSIFVNYKIVTYNTWVHGQHLPATQMEQDE